MIKCWNISLAIEVQSSKTLKDILDNIKSIKNFVAH
jgi:hypothetical protein